MTNKSVASNYVLACLTRRPLEPLRCSDPADIISIAGNGNYQILDGHCILLSVGRRLFSAGAALRPLPVVVPVGPRVK